MSLLFFDKFVYSRCLFTKPTKEDNIYHSTMLNNGAPVFIQLPKLKTINGIHWHDNRCYLDLELTKAVLDFFLHFEQENIQTAFKNSEKWFGKEMPLDIIESNYLSIIKLDSNKSYIRFSIPVVNNKECGIHVYNQFKERINTDNIIPKTNVGVILKCNGLVMGKENYVLIGKLNKLNIIHNQNQRIHICFLKTKQKIWKLWKTLHLKMKNILKIISMVKIKNKIF